MASYEQELRELCKLALEKEQTDARTLSRVNQIMEHYTNPNARDHYHAALIYHIGDQPHKAAHHAQQALNLFESDKENNKLGPSERLSVMGWLRRTAAGGPKPVPSVVTCSNCGGAHFSAICIKPKRC